VSCGTSTYGSTSHFVERDDLDFVLLTLKDNWEKFCGCDINSVDKWPTEWKENEDGKYAEIWYSKKDISWPLRLDLYIHPVLCVNGTYIQMNYFNPNDLEQMKTIRPHSRKKDV
jgi:hypothetical protein